MEGLAVFEFGYYTVDLYINKSGLVYKLISGSKIYVQFAVSAFFYGRFSVFCKEFIVDDFVWFAFSFVHFGYKVEHAFDVAWGRDTVAELLVAEFVLGGTGYNF